MPLCISISVYCCIRQQRNDVIFNMGYEITCIVTSGLCNKCGAITLHELNKKLYSLKMYKIFSFVERL